MTDRTLPFPFPWAEVMNLRLICLNPQFAEKCIVGCIGSKRRTEVKAWNLLSPPPPLVHLFLLLLSLSSLSFDAKTRDRRRVEPSVWDGCWCFQVARLSQLHSQILLSSVRHIMTVCMIIMMTSPLPALHFTHCVYMCPLQRLWTEHAGELKVPNVLSSSSFAHSSLSRAELSVCTQYIVLYIYCMSMWRNNTPFFSSLLSQSTARAFVFSSAWRLSFLAAKLKKWWWHSHIDICVIYERQLSGAVILWSCRWRQLTMSAERVMDAVKDVPSFGSAKMVALAAGLSVGVTVGYMVYRHISSSSNDDDGKAGNNELWLAGAGTVSSVFKQWVKVLLFTATL